MSGTTATCWWPVVKKKWPHNKQEGIQARFDDMKKGYTRVVIVQYHHGPARGSDEQIEIRKGNIDFLRGLITIYHITNPL